MGDDVRDMALTARERADSAHRRIDSYNGQISRVGTEVASLRTDVGKDLLDIKLELGSIKTRTAMWAAIFAVVGGGFVSAVFGLILFLAKDALIEQPREARPPAVTAPAQEPVRAAKPPGGANTRSRPTRVRAARTETPGRAAETRPDRAPAPVPASPAPPVEEEDDPIRDLVETVLTVATGTLPLP